MKPTLKAEYASIYVVYKDTGLPSREQMLAAVRYSRRMQRSGLWIDPDWNPRTKKGNRAIRRYHAIEVAAGRNVRVATPLNLGCLRLGLLS